MKWFYLIVAFAAVLFSQRSSLAEEPKAEPKTKTIPLDQIWAYEMPGTRDIRKLEPKRDTRNMSKKEYILGSLVNHIVVLLQKVPAEGEKAGPAFVVAGTDQEALKNAHAVFTAKEKEKRASQPRDSDLTLVFYSYLTGWHPQINSVEQSPGLITVKYQFIASRGHSEATRFTPIPLSDSVTRFALVPIGKFSEGTVQVKIEEVPAVDVEGQPVRPKREPDRYISGSFSFDVR